VQLLPHQIEARERLKNQHGLILNWNVGSGKSVGAIASMDPYGKTEAIVPASLRNNFKKELRAYKPKSKFNVSSYEKAIKQPQAVEGKNVIFDEAQRLRNSGTKRSQIANYLAHKANKVLLLSGTPMQNHPSEIAPLVNIAAGKTVLPEDRKAFDSIYLKHVKDNPGFIRRMFGAKFKDEYQPNNLEDFKKRVSPYVLSYQMPKDKYSPTVRVHENQVEMDKNQVDVYHTLEHKLPGKIRQAIERKLPADKNNIGRLNAFLSATRQISNTPDKFYKEDGAQYSPKIKKLLENVKASPGKSLIYSNYLDSGTTPISELLSKNKIPHAVFSGKLNDVERKKIVNQYNRDKLKALIVSSSGGEGIDLKKTRSIHILEPHWNTPKTDQVIGRGIRFNSHKDLSEKDRTVDIHKYYSTLPEKRHGFLWMKKSRPTSADDYLKALSDKKKNLTDQFMGALK